MSKRVRRARLERRRRSRTSPARRDLQAGANTQLIDSRGGAGLLERLLATPQIATIVPRLQPQVLHRVIQHCGLEDCGPLVALATPGQLAGLFDLDLWRQAAPGLDEQFDADRFGTWLDVMVDTDVSMAAATIAALDVDLIATALVQHVRVFNYAAIAPYTMLDGEEVSHRRASDPSLRREIGGLVVFAKRTTFWDAITSVLVALSETHGSAFYQIMRETCRLSSAPSEIDVDDLPTADDQAMIDVAIDREVRRDTRGYVTPAQARAFLEASRRIDLRQEAAPHRDAMTRAYFRGIEAQTATVSGTESTESPPRDRGEPAPEPPADAIAAIVELLHEAGAMPRAPRALLEGPQTGAPRLARVRVHLQVAQERDPGAYGTRSAELAYLANVIAAGSTIQSRPVGAEEASTAAAAVCNLGLENWPARWLAADVRRRQFLNEAATELPEDFLIHHDLVSVFQVGWTVLHDDVCMYAADQLISVLTSVHCVDDYVQDALDTLRATLTKHVRAGSPWDAQDELDVFAMLDMPSAAALVGLIDRFPTMHAAVAASLVGSTRQIDPTAFEFIADNGQIRQIHDFMRLLPDRLSG